MKEKLLLTLALWLALVVSTWAQSNALHFDGTGDYVACPAINPAQFTVEAWVYPTALDKDQAIVSTLNVNGKVGMELHLGTDNLPIITINNNGSFIDVKGDNPISANTWTHLAATYNGADLTLYVNGAVAKSESYSSYRNGAAPVNLGKRYNETTYNFTGKIDDVRIWNAARSQSDIADAKDNQLNGTETNLLAYYNFNQGTADGTNTSITTLTDATSNGKHGTLTSFALTGSASNWVEGYAPAVTKNSLHFDGTNDYVACPVINPNHFTVEAWVFPTQLDRKQPVLSTLSQVANTGIELHITDGNLPLITLRNGSSWLDVKATSTVNWGNWVHLAATYDGSEVKLYVNGKEAKTAAATNYVQGNSLLHLGKRSEGNASLFAGRIDEVRIWEVVRTEVEILAAMNASLAGTESGLIVYYNFNQGIAGGDNSTETTLIDASGNNKNGTLQNFALVGNKSNWVSENTILAPEIIYVKADAQGMNNGTSWDNAYNSLVPALSSAISGDQIWVAAGNYYTTTTGSIDEMFVLKNDVAIYGGFAGTETLLTQRNIESNETILNGDLGAQGVKTDNTRTLVYARNVSNTAILDGFTITNAYSTRAIFIWAASPQLRNLTITNNHSKDDGAGIYILSGAPTIINCSITNNVAAKNGGAIYVLRCAPAPKIINCTIANNEADLGGGIYSEGTFLTLKNSIVWGNKAKIGNQFYYLNALYLDNSCYSNAAGDVYYTVSTPSPTNSITTDPKFVNAAGNDFRIQGNSPCKDKGDNGQNPLSTDVRGRSRIQNTTIDMGAYEYTSGFDPAVVNNWTGATSTNWATAGNWSAGSVPISTTTVVIPQVTNHPTIGKSAIARSSNITINTGAVVTIASGATLSVTGQLVNNNGVDGLLLISDATGTGKLVNNTPSVPATVQQYIVQDQWHYFGLPIEGSHNANNLLHNFYVVKSNEDRPMSNPWEYLTAQDNLTRGQGYGAFYSRKTNNDTTLVFKGLLNTGTITVETSNSGDDLGWNFVSNPYPCTLDWNVVKNNLTEIEDAVYVWNPTLNDNNKYGRYGTYVDGVQVNAQTQYIAPMQGFFVKAKAGNGGVSFTNAAKSTQPSTFKSAELNALIRLNASDTNGYDDETVVRFKTGSTHEFDSRYDARKLNALSSLNPQIYSVLNGDEYSINSIPEATVNTVIPFELLVKSTGTQQIAATELTGLDATLDVVLEDLQTGARTLLANSAYRFSATAGETRKFNLLFADATSVNRVEARTIKAYGAESRMCISNMSDGRNAIWVYNLNGQLVHQTNAEGSYTEVELPNGLYVVKVTPENGNVFNGKVRIGSFK